MKTNHTNTSANPTTKANNSATLSLFDAAGEPSIHARPTIKPATLGPAAALTPPTEPSPSPEMPAPAEMPSGKRRRTDAERAASHAERAEKAKAILTSGLSEIATDPEALGRYLAFRSRFHTYSPTNTVLILMQRPSARYCMGYRSWQKHGRQVRRGERGLMVYAPILSRPTKDEIASGAGPDERKARGFRVATTFDYEQTDATGEGALVYESPLPRLGTETAPDLVRSLRALAAAWGYSVEAASGYADGYCDFARRVIGVRADLAADDEAAVLAHELAHAAAHDPKQAGYTHQLSSAEREIQAEGAAFQALSMLGLDTSRAALPYLKGYAADGDAVAAQLAEIERIARLLIDALSQP